MYRMKSTIVLRRCQDTSNLKMLVSQINSMAVTVLSLIFISSILSTFKEEYNPNFNDEGVKRAVRAWEDYAARDKSSHNAAADRDLEEMSKSDEHNGLNWEEYENEDVEGDTDVRK